MYIIVKRENRGLIIADNCVSIPRHLGAMGCRQVVRRLPLEQIFVGSSPATPD